MVSMIYFDHSRLKILMFCTLTKIGIFKSSGFFLTFTHAFGGCRFPNRFDPDQTAPQSSPTGSTHSSYNMNQLIKRQCFFCIAGYVH